MDILFFLAVTFPVVVALGLLIYYIVTRAILKRSDLAVYHIAIYSTDDPGTLITTRRVDDEAAIEYASKLMRGYSNAYKCMVLDSHGKPIFSTHN